MSVVAKVQVHTVLISPLQESSAYLAAGTTSGMLIDAMLSDVQTHSMVSESGMGAVCIGLVLQGICSQAGLSLTPSLPWLSHDAVQIVA